jgi:hypothetical protein
MAEDQETAPEAEDPKAEDPHRRRWSDRVFHKLFGTPQAAAATTFCGTAIIAVLGWTIFSPGSSSPRVVVASPGASATAAGASTATPSEISSSSSLRRYVLSRDFWGRTPTVFNDSLNTAFQQEGSNNINLGGEDGVIDAFSTADLIPQAPHYQGTPLLVVGKIEDAISSPVSWDYSYDSGSSGMSDPTDVQILGPHGRAKAYALIDGNEDSTSLNNKVVFFPAVLVATGETSNGNQTIYLVGLNAPDDVSFYGITTNGKTVGQIAREFGVEPHPTGSSAASGAALPFFP